MSDNVVQTTMDSGVCRLCVDAAGASSVVAITYEFIRREYMLDRVTIHEEFTAETVYPRGSLLSGSALSSASSGVRRCPPRSRVYGGLSVAVRVSTA
ncbi:hypothetical protein BKA82DRAFT_20956 [Pisolithus tinctorius]|uniref:Uncharacterized protein n=1 Tax=Pisolithus tinctorius Marx 270 TaxID=870435 RepID=A0A0C3JNE1_PISTI|nr:hypothetical protein BKA82DRAFT_20956 [Pisolithus tinctorius]KIO10708.1 hypothetical protein M404DRAFT_20956 [Pisolithus tinctorius Marx 270]